MKKDKFVNKVAEEDSDVSEEEDDSSFDEEETSGEESEGMNDSSFLDQEAEEADSDDDNEEDDDESDDDDSEDKMDYLENKKAVSTKMEQTKEVKSKISLKKGQAPPNISKVAFPKSEKNLLKTTLHNDRQKNIKNQKSMSEEFKWIMVRFPKTPTEHVETLLKEICGHILNIRPAKVRGRSYWFLEFDSSEICANSMKKIRKTKVRGKTLRASYIQSCPDELIADLAEKRQKALKKANRLRKQKKKDELKANKTKLYATSVIVENIPNAAVTEQIKNVFPYAEKVKLFNKKGSETKSAYISFLSNTGAKKARKQNVVKSGRKLSIRYHMDKKAKPMKKASKKASETKELKPQTSTVSNESGEQSKVKRKLTSGENVGLPKKGKFENSTVDSKKKIINQENKKEAIPKENTKNKGNSIEHKSKVINKTTGHTAGDNKLKSLNKIKSEVPASLKQVAQKDKTSSFEKKNSSVQLEKSFKNNRNKKISLKK